MREQIENTRAQVEPPPPPKKRCRQAAIEAQTGLSGAYFEKDRYFFRGKAPGIPYIKVGRAVLYDPDEVMAALEKRGSKSLEALAGKESKARTASGDAA